jgi:N-acetylneuraminic acid mutarotase
MIRIAILLGGLLAFPAVSQAHFLWLLHDPVTGKAQVYFSELAEPDDPALLEKCVKAEVWAVAGRGEPKPLTLTKTAETLEATLDSAAKESALILRHQYGVMSRGGESFLLNYYAKTYPFPMPKTWRAVKNTDKLPLEVTPTRQGKQMTFHVTWNDKPLPAATVTIVGPGIEKKLEGNADEAGNFTCELPQGGVFSIRVKQTETAAGKFEDKEFKSIRHYSTLTLHYEPSSLTPQINQLPDLPEGTTSFGGAVAGDTLYVFGGNYGGAHKYTKDDQSGDLWTLNLKSPTKWEMLEVGPRRQGLAMVEYKGVIYRLGGFEAMNNGSEAQDLRSRADFARWDAAGAKWETLPSLPEPRSSHDAAMVGDMLYVVGGWNMQGGDQGAKWHDTAWAMNLAADKLEWKTVASPGFKRRALALAAWDGKLVCIGGMQEKGGATTSTMIYDPARNEWAEGAKLLGAPMDGFGSSAFACRGTLYVTTISGSIQSLSADGKQWQYVGQLEQPRFFHRVLPWSDSKLVIVGGTSMETGKTTKVEVLTIPTASAVTTINQ